MRNPRFEGDVQARLRALFRAGGHEQITAVAHEAARQGRARPLPANLPTPLHDALQSAGISEIYGHQLAAYQALQTGENVAISTGTASGKSLCYQLAILDRRERDDQSRALLLFPTKALAQDQARKLAALCHDALPAIYDGDTPPPARGLIRRSATMLLSNPDMIHAGMLPNHGRWAEFLHHLDFVVLDEAHVYRGVFGSHVAQVLRRLRRLCHRYGGTPQFIVTSATVANAASFAERLAGVPFAVVGEDEAPRPERTIVFWNPPLLDAGRGERASALAEAAYLTTECVLAGARVITFAPTRKAAELIYGHVRRRLADRDPEAAERIQPYRAGYTPQQRRDIERRLFVHELDAVIATQALELGIDVGALDVSIVTGFPGTVTSLRQRWGRAGRKEHGWAVLVGGEDALDQYFMRDSERLLSRSVEEAIVDLRNEHILRPHLGAAAYEEPITAEDAIYFGEPALQLAESMAQTGRLRRHDGRLVWAGARDPSIGIGLRTASAERFVIAEASGGEIIGEVEDERVFRIAHPGAVYLHLGKTYLVKRLDLENRSVLVDEFNGAYYTQAKTEKNILIAGQSDVRALANAAVCYGTVEVTEQVIGYQRRDATNQRVIDSVSIELPEQTFSTQALWVAVSAETLAQTLAGLDDDQMVLPGALHAAEHAIIALMPLYATCDRWDIGGLSIPWHGQTDTATIFVYDGYSGGIGLARRGYEAFESLVADAATLVAACSCESGCPSCIQSPKCGNLNEPLNKAGALRLLRALIEEASSSSPPRV